MTHRQALNRIRNIILKDDLAFGWLLCQFLNLKGHTRKYTAIYRQHCEEATLNYYERNLARLFAVLEKPEEPPQ